MPDRTYESGGGGLVAARVAGQPFVMVLSVKSSKSNSLMERRFRVIPPRHGFG
jgi:hypothetical protein